MTEPSVQVPVSVAKLAAHYLGRDGFRHLAGRLQDALLSQPTPTAECTYEPCGIHGTAFDDDCGWCWVETTAAPPSIADMAPGATFVANPRGWTNPARWVVVQDGRAVSTDSWRWVTQDDIDPSTIRDVTPPAGT